MATAYDSLLDEPPKKQSPHPPKPRSAGANSHLGDEDKLVAQIEAENRTESFDSDIETQAQPETPMLVFGEDKKSRLGFLRRPKFWVSFIGFLLVVATFAWLVTPSRLWLVNSLGLKAEVVVTTAVVAPEGAPSMLKNTAVVINGQSFQTDENGKARARVAYGSLHIEASKAGYESVIKDDFLDIDPFFGWLGGAQADANIRQPVLLMKNVGVSVSFIAKDWLTGLPITSGSFSVGDVVAHPSSDGKVSLALPATDDKTVLVSAAFTTDYTSKQIEVVVGNTSQEIVFVPAGNHHFISKRSGQYAVYSSKLDGSEVTELVPLATAETGDITFSVNQAGTHGVLGSTREATRDSFGSVQQKLYVVDVATKRLTAVDTALRFELIDWSGNTLVYKASFRTGSGAMVQRLASVEVTPQVRQKSLTADSTYTAARVCLNSVVYLRADGELRTISLTGGTEKSLGTNVQQVTQSNATTFVYQIAGGWHSYDVNASQVQTAQTPGSTNRAFLANRSRDGQNYLVADTIDGIPTIFAKAVGNGQEVKLFSGQGITAPIGWVGNVVVYRVGSADFAVSPRGGAPKKITDVSPSSNNNGYPSFN